jgi:hypothetical protein
VLSSRESAAADLGSGWKDYVASTADSVNAATHFNINVAGRRLWGPHSESWLEFSYRCSFYLHQNNGNWRKIAARNTTEKSANGMTNRRNVIAL